MTKILLIGLYGTFNYGCEAIVRGSVDILKVKYSGNCDITLATPKVLDDTKRLKGCDVNIKERKIHRFKPQNLIRKLATKVGVHFPVIIEDIEQLADFDEVYSIGGDIYTLDHRGESPLSYMAFGEYCLNKNIPYSMLCCSIGPFNDNKETAKYIVPHLKKITKIYAREHSTIEYLKSIDVVDNVEYLPDPAFQVGKDMYKEEHSKKIKIVGINLSPLSSLHFYGSIEEAVRIQSHSIINAIHDCEVNIKLLPHVYSASVVDDDLRYLQEIYNVVKGQVGDKVELCEHDVGFVGRKSDILQCDLVIAARMHCAVNSICCNVPTFFLSYSAKAKGMAKVIYDSDKFTGDLLQFENLVELIHISSKIPSFRDKVKSLQDLSAYGF